MNKTKENIKNITLKNITIVYDTHSLKNKYVCVNDNTIEFLKNDFLIVHQELKLYVLPATSVERYPVAVIESGEIIGNCYIDSCETSLFLHNYFQKPENEKLILYFKPEPLIYKDWKRYELL
jgi:hypothetical protein